MRKEHSYGIIPLRLHEKKWQVLLVHHRAGHWAFPKGHPERDESPRQAAERELREETGLIVHRYLLSEPLTENYIFTLHGEQVFKTVQYFLALVKGQEVIQESEIQAIQWLSLPKAYDRITFQEGKNVCLQVSEFLKTLDDKGNPLLA